MHIDLVHLVRTLRRSPAGAIAAILTLTLTLGAGTAIFAVVDAVLLTPPAYRNPDELITLGETPVDEPTGVPRAISVATLDAWRDRARALASIDAFDPTNVTLTGLGAAQRARATDVTPGFLSLLGVSPVMGRGFGPEDEGRPVVIVSHAFWRGTLGGEPAAIGRTLMLGGESHTIVGVLPERFFFALDVSDIWRPMPRPSTAEARARTRVRVVARLAANVSAASLANALNDVSRTATPPSLAIATPLMSAVAGGSTRTLALLAGAAALAVLIAFINLAGLLLVRSIDRGRELAVRSALGARRFEIARQLIVEAMAVVAVGTIAGVLLAFWLTPAVGRLALQQFGGVATQSITVSWRVIAMVLLSAAACGSMCGTMTAFMASRRNIADILRRGATAAPRERWLRRAFVAGVVSLACVLLVSVMLVGRSLMTVLAMNPGFSPDGVMTAGLAPPPARYPSDDRLVSFYSTLERELEQRIGARSVALVDELPLNNDRGRGLVSARATDPAREAVIRTASAAYFDVMRIPVLAGRAFERRDDTSSPTRVVVSQSLAAGLFPGESPLGRQVQLPRAQTAEIIGVVGDVKHRSFDEPTLPTLYVSAWQFPSRGSRLLVRTARSDADAIAIMREQVGRLDADLPLYGVVSMSDVVANSPGLPARRVLTAAFLGFALLAVVLGAIGLFGLVAHDVASRRIELALRIALGANPQRLLNATLAQSSVIVGSGIVVGAVLSYWASQVLNSIVPNTSIDVISLAMAAAVLLIAGATAVVPVARRASRTDPLIVLRG